MGLVNNDPGEIETVDEITEVLEGEDFTADLTVHPTVWNVRHAETALSVYLFSGEIQDHQVVIPVISQFNLWTGKSSVLNVRLVVGELLDLDRKTIQIDSHIHHVLRQLSTTVLTSPAPAGLGSKKIHGTSLSSGQIEVAVSLISGVRVRSMMVTVPGR